MSAAALGLTAAVLPREGDIAIVTPHFEEPSVRESLEVPAEVRVWNEHDDPLATVAGILRVRQRQIGQDLSLSVGLGDLLQAEGDGPIAGGAYRHRPTCPS